MKKLYSSRLTALALLFISTFVQATPMLFVDAAPNRFGSPDYANWEANAFAAVANETFVNMASSADPANVGTTNFEIEDEAVYSFGDLGKRLTWIYWLPGESVSDLDAGNRFSVSLTNIWDGEELDFYQYYYGTTWLEPTSWIDYDIDSDGIVDGVIGTSGMAWWGAYGTNTQAALDADLAAWGSVDETWIFTARLDGEEVSLTSQRSAVPVPPSLALLGLGIVAIGFTVNKRKA